MQRAGWFNQPDYLHIRSGDTVKFIATDVTHNAASVAEMLPAGAASFKGQINQEIEVTFDARGLYGIRCIPHWAMGMVMLIQVGEPDTAVPLIPAELPPQVGERCRDILTR